MNFNKIHKSRKEFINKNKNIDHAVLLGHNNILISAPHGVSQVRLGRYKFSEIGSLATALYLQDKTKCYFIAKSKNNNDDANFDEVSHYKNDLADIIKKYNIKYLIDFHGLAAKRDCGVNLGTHIGDNIRNNTKTFNNLYNKLISNGFITTIDNPFMGGNHTISGSMIDKFPHLWTLQIEINCAITNKKENFEKYKKLLTILIDWIKSLEK